MARTAAGWGWYGRMNDDVRSHLIDQAWFGQTPTNDMEASAESAFQARENALDASVWRRLPDADMANANQEADQLYGPAADPTIDPEFDDAQSVEDFYDYAREAEAEQADLYGHAPEQAMDGPEQEVD